MENKDVKHERCTGQTKEGKKKTWGKFLLKKRKNESRGSVLGVGWGRGYRRVRWTKFTTGSIFVSFFDWILLRNGTKISLCGISFDLGMGEYRNSKNVFSYCTSFLIRPATNEGLKKKLMEVKAASHSSLEGTNTRINSKIYSIHLWFLP